jgi:hypothetical protein
LERVTAAEDFIPHRTMAKHSLNPCDNPRHHRRNLYNVHGRTTNICADCLFEKEKEPGKDRWSALATFTPDPDGVPCHVSSPSKPDESQKIPRHDAEAQAQA